MAEACAALADGARAKTLYELALPFTERYVFVGYGAICGGSIAHYLGLLAATMGRLDDAESHFADAMERNARIGGTVWLARTRVDFARALLDRGRPGDRERAGTLLEQALAAASELGLAAVGRKGASVLERAGEEPPTPAAGNVFRREGEYWTLAYEGDTARVKDSKGIRDLATLLARPGVQIAALDLVGASEGHSPSDTAAAASSAGEQALDSRARAEYRQRIRDLEEEIGEAESSGDAWRASTLRGERDAIVSALTGAYGLGGRPRRAGHPSERARQAVSWRIREAVARIERVHAALGRHLRRSIKTGIFCSYAPDDPVAWAL